MLKAIHARESRAAAEMTAERVRAITATVGETLAYHPHHALAKIRTNNGFERLLAKSGAARA